MNHRGSIRSAAVGAGVVVIVGSLVACGTSPLGESVDGTSFRQRQVDGLVLITHETFGASDAALLIGELGANAASCITVGGTVVVFPDEDDLLGDGSLRRNGREYLPGASVRLGGGFGEAPAALGALCGAERYPNAGSGS